MDPKLAKSVFLRDAQPQSDAPFMSYPGYLRTFFWHVLCPGQIDKVSIFLSTDLSWYADDPSRPTPIATTACQRCSFHLTWDGKVQTGGKRCSAQGMYHEANAIAYTIPIIQAHSYIDIYIKRGLRHTILKLETVPHAGALFNRKVYDDY
jgi:hypothetical protein